MGYNEKMGIDTINLIRHGVRRRMFVKRYIALLAAALIGLFAPVLMAQARFDSADRALRTFEQVFRFLEERYVFEVDESKLLEGALRGLFASLDDPYSAYLSEDDMRDIVDTTQGVFGGVGLYINKQVPPPEGGAAYIEIISPIEGTPAFFADIQAGDLITNIEGESTSEISTEEAVERLRGAPASIVNVTIRRGSNVEFDVDIERAIIEIPTTRQAIINGSIGYLRIINFTPLTPMGISKSIDILKDQGYRSLIIDVRSNPGGSLDGVINAVDLFFNDGLIVGTRDRQGEEERIDATPGAIVSDTTPIVILIDRGSASASEIFAGAFKDRGRATLIGETTYGKGSVQQVRALDKGGFRLTTSLYFTPSGAYIDKKGVLPDIAEVEPEISDEASQAYVDLRDDSEIADYLSANPRLDEAGIRRYAARIKSRKSDVDLDERYLRRIIRNRLNRANNIILDYDLDFDIPLRRAVDLISRR